MEKKRAMIGELSIKNLSLIDSLDITFDKGFSVFTGETGAGKSILLGAIGILLGDRVSAEVIRDKAAEAEISGVFDLTFAADGLMNLLSDASIPIEQQTLIIRRIITRGERNRMYANQVPVTLSVLKSIGEQLIDIHSQHEHQSLLRPAAAVALIDGIPAVQRQRREYDGSYAALQRSRAALADFDRASAALADRRSLIEFQYGELSQLQLKPDEERLLEEEYRLLSSVAQRQECVVAVRTLIEEGSEGGESMERTLHKIVKQIEALAQFDSGARVWIDDVERMQDTLSELGRYCASYLSNTGQGLDPGRLETINGRLARIQRLRKRYQCTFEELVKMEGDLRLQLSSLDNKDADRSLLLKENDAVLRQCREKASALTRARTAACTEFDAAVTRQMERLGFQGGAWKTVFTPHGEPAADGAESAHFEVRTNPGESFLPLVKTASGGELSRLTLAIKTVFATQAHIPVLVFDEIDAGIGGNTAVEVAQALHALSKQQQVLCISHLHQIASKALHHYKVYKVLDRERTVVRVQRLTEKEKIEEISRMLGSQSATAKRHAAELLAGEKP